MQRWCKYLILLFKKKKLYREAHRSYLLLREFSDWYVQSIAIPKFIVSEPIFLSHDYSNYVHLLYNQAIISIGPSFVGRYFLPYSCSFVAFFFFLNTAAFFSSRLVFFPWPFFSSLLNEAVRVTCRAELWRCVLFPLLALWEISQFNKTLAQITWYACLSCLSPGNWEKHISSQFCSVTLPKSSYLI